MGPAEEEATGEEEGEGCGVLVVKLTNASISVVKGRGCDAGCPTLECQGTGCRFKEVILVANSSTVTQGEYDPLAQYLFAISHYGTVVPLQMT